MGRNHKGPKNTLDEIKAKKELKYNISGIYSKHN
jgi:hypothetical protein